MDVNISTTVWDDLIGWVLGVRHPVMLLGTNAKHRIGWDHSLNASVETYAYILALATDMHCTVHMA